MNVGAASTDSRPDQLTVSVVIPCYNVSRWIRETLESVFAQTFTGFEVILVNDGSPDAREFRAAVEPFRDRLTVVDQPNKGPAGARNTGVRLAKGDFIAFLDGDDIWDPDYLERQLERIRSSEKIAVVYSNARLFGNPGPGPNTLMGHCPSTGDLDAFAVVRGTCTVLTPFSVVRRSALLEIGGFDESLRFAEDFHLWIRMAMMGKCFSYTTDTLGKYRVRTNSQSGAVVSNYLHILRVLDYAAAATTDPKVRQAARDRWHEMNDELRRAEGKMALRNREYAVARTAFDNVHSSSWKLRLTRLALRCAPRAAWLGARMWDSLARLRAAVS